MSFPRYEKYKDSGVEWLGEVPAHWTEHAIKRCVNGCVNGIWGDEPDGENDIIVLRVADFDRRKLCISDEKLTYRAISEKDSQPRLLKVGDLLMEKSGGGEKTLVGCVVLFDKDYSAVTSNFLAKMTPKENWDSKFLLYVFSHLYAGRVNFPSIKQTTGIQNIDSQSYLIEQFTFPTLLEQRTIAAFLDHETGKIDALVAEQEKLIGLLKEKRQAVISHAVTKGLNPNARMKDSGVEWLGEVPEGWEVCHLRRLFEICKRIAGEDGHDVLSITQRGIRIKDIESGDGQLSMDYSKYQFVEPGDFAMNHMDLLTGYVDISPYFGVTSPDYRVFRLLNSRNHHGQYFLYLFQNAYKQKIFFPFGQGSAQLGRWRLPTDEFLTFCLPVPTLDEQIAIARFLDNETTKIDALIEESQKAINLMKERRTALISAAVTGKIDVRGYCPA